MSVQSIEHVYAKQLDALGKSLNVKPSWIAAVLAIESAGQLNARNPVSGAYGLIQFMPATLKDLGADISRMGSADYQFRLMYQYFIQKIRGRKIHDAFELYLAVFYPAAIGKPGKYILGSEKSANWAGIIARQNPGYASQGVITKRDMRKKWYKLAAAKGYKPGTFEKLRMIL